VTHELTVILEDGDNLERLARYLLHLESEEPIRLAMEAHLEHQKDTPHV
jgi:hypothetical protein